MNLNSDSRFSKTPVNNISRSIFDRSNTLVTSFSAGKLIPIYLDEVLPGDTCTMDMSFLCRMATPLYPVMDNAWIDVHFFYVPFRLVWDNWEEFCGVGNHYSYDSTRDYEVPTDFYTPGANNFSGYIGLPRSFSTGNPLWCKANALPRRAYWLIWNEWFRDQNLQDPILIDTGNAGNPAEPGIEIDVDSILPVNKYHDYFTSCLPEPQNGDSVRVFADGGALALATTGKPYKAGIIRFGSDMNFQNSTGGTMMDYDTVYNLVAATGVSSSDATLYGVAGGDKTNPVIINHTNLFATTSNSDFPANIYTTVENLRRSFAIQRLVERDNRGGRRYRELVKAHFGVDVPDARVQVPEYLGGCHVPVNIMQVVQQSSTKDELSPLGETGAVSKTVHSGSMFTKSFVEHGYIMGFASVRTQHSYMQGIPRLFNRRKRFDFYWPELANIGDQAVMAKEIYGVADDDSVFGYQEAWADYRYKPNQITGNMSIVESSEDTPSSLGPWHYGDFYQDQPSLSDGFIRETDENIARTLAVSDTKVFDQFLFDCYFKARWARPMPVYSIPGLSGHF